jgi:hypothetical protein
LKTTNSDWQGLEKVLIYIQLFSNICLQTEELRRLIWICSGCLQAWNIKAHYGFYFKFRINFTLPFPSKCAYCVENWYVTHLRNVLKLQDLLETLLGALAKLRKATASVVLSVSVRPHVITGLLQDGFSSSLICIFRKSVEQIQVSLKSLILCVSIPLCYQIYLSIFYRQTQHSRAIVSFIVLI